MNFPARNGQKNPAEKLLIGFFERFIVINTVAEFPADYTSSMVGILSVQGTQLWHHPQA